MPSASSALPALPGSVTGSASRDGQGPERCAAYVEEHHPAVDVVVYEGGQDRYPLLVGVE